MKQNLYTSDTTLSCGIPWTIPRVSCIFSVYDECVYQENTSDKWNIPWYTTRERYITILYYAIEIQWLTESMRHTHGDEDMGRSGIMVSNIQQVFCILIGCIFHIFMVKKLYL